MSHTEPVLIPPRRLAVIGGDGRMTHASERLGEAGHEVAILGFGAEGMPAETHGGRIWRAATPEAAMEGADAVILPLPATRDGMTVACPREPGCRVWLDEIVEAMERRPRLMLLGGRLPEDMCGRIQRGDDGGGRVVDYYLDEGVQMRNAYITAEAALMSAMQMTDRTLRGMTVAVIGYGRIGRMLAHLLRALGAEVTVAARREESLLWAECEGAHPLPMRANDRPGGGLFPLCFEYDVIFNTVPVRILGEDQLSRMEAGTLILDLASAPYGVDEADAAQAVAAGVRYVRAPALPGVYAPREAGYILADCVLGVLRRAANRKEGLI